MRLDASFFLTSDGRGEGPLSFLINRMSDSAYLRPTATLFYLAHLEQSGVIVLDPASSIIPKKCA